MPPRSMRNVKESKEATRRRLATLENAIITLANQNNQATRGQSTFDRFDRHRPATYNGVADPLILEGSLREIENLFDATGFPPEERVAIGTYYLKFEADNWWSTVKNECLATSGFGWPQFAEKLKTRFYPDELRWQKQEEFLSLNQGLMSVQEYTDKFTELSRFALNIIPTEAKRVKRYIKKMNPRVRTHILSFGTTTFQGAYETALSIHASILEEERSKVVTAKKQFPSTYQSPTKKPRFDNAKKGIYQQGSGSRQGVGPKKCWGCGKEIHPGKNCDGSRVVCYYCKEEGHKTYQCPKKGGAPNTRAASLQRGMINCMTQQEVDTHPDVVSGTFLLNNVYAYVLLDTGATMSFISSSFVSRIGLSASSVVKSLVTLPSGDEYPAIGNLGIYLL
ncbi:unnamed protein product [Amaranthus hypochondriacus]